MIVASVIILSILGIYIFIRIRRVYILQKKIRSNIIDALKVSVSETRTQDHLEQYKSEARMLRYISDKQQVKILDVIISDIERKQNEWMRIEFDDVIDTITANIAKKRTDLNDHKQMTRPPNKTRYKKPYKRHDS